MSDDIRTKTIKECLAQMPMPYSEDQGIDVEMANYNEGLFSYKAAIENLLSPINCVKALVEEYEAQCDRPDDTPWGLVIDDFARWLISQGKLKC